MKKTFKLHAPFKPAGSQPEAISKLIKARAGKSTLIGVTGSGKTFTMANVIASQNKPVLILSPNKTLAAQLYEEFSLFFPENKVCYFVSYYDYYQPESYLPSQDVYVAKETKVNSEIERLRIETTASLINRTDTIVIASVSAIYSLGNPDDYRNLGFALKAGQKIKRRDLIHRLIYIQYQRNDIKKTSGTFAVNGNTIEVRLPYQKEMLRIEMFGDTIENLQWVDAVNHTVLMPLDNTVIFPAKHFVTTQAKKDAAVHSIKQELDEHVSQIQDPVVRHRITQRVSHDLEMLEQMGYCSGIENYSSHFDGRQAGEPPFCLFDFFPKDFLCIIDESHMALPQFRGMYAGDRSRKASLIEYGFRLPSAFENRPLQFQEIERYFNDVVFVSATPSDYELRNSDTVVEQLIRPTGLVDPVIETHKREGQIDHLIEQINLTTQKGLRSLVMVMTKKSAEQLAHYLEERQLKVCYLHSELKTPQRTELLQKLRLGVFDCLVGVNLLREGIDLPEVALVAVMDADIESFMRDKRSLIQIMGRAARNTESKVILYADKMTKSMRGALDESQRRRVLQQAYNKEHNITPQSVQREVTKSITDLQAAIQAASSHGKRQARKQAVKGGVQKRQRLIELEAAMHKAAKELNFEKAIALRTEWQQLQKG